MTAEPAVEGDGVVVDRAEGYATITLDRPHRKNALTGPVFVALAAAVEELGADDDIAALVLRGAGGGFCSGIDLTELQADPPHPWAPQLGELARQAHIALYRCPCPIITAVERFAINAGAALALAGDLVVVGESGFVQIGEIIQGARIPMNAAWVRLRASESVLARLAFTGDRVTGAELGSLGLATHVVADAAVLDTATALAHRMASFPAGSSRNIKTDVRELASIDPDTWFFARRSDALLSADQVRS